MRLFGKKKTFPLIPCRPLIANIQTFLNAFYPKRHPVQDAKCWNYIPCLRHKTLKTIPCSAAYTRQGQIIEWPPPPPSGRVRHKLKYKTSLHSKRFRASSSRNLGWEQKRGIKGEGEGRKGNLFPLPLPLRSSFFCYSRSIFSALTPSETLAA